MLQAWEQSPRLGRMHSACLGQHSTSPCAQKTGDTSPLENATSPSSSHISRIHQKGAGLKPSPTTSLGEEEELLWSMVSARQAAASCCITCRIWCQSWSKVCQAIKKSPRTHPDKMCPRLSDRTPSESQKNYEMGLKTERLQKFLINTHLFLHLLVSEPSDS